MKTKLLLPLTLSLTFISCSPAHASCYGLTGYDLVNCLNDERERQFYQNKFDQAIKPKPYEGYIDNRQTCTKQIVNTGTGYYVQTICK
jgi:hypothetical protein